MKAYCGIDVACAKRKALPIAVAVREGVGFRTLPLKTSGLRPPRGAGNRIALEPEWCASFADETAAYLQAVEQKFDVTIAEIAIDAPRLPAGTSRRAAEVAMDRMGISCISTPSVAKFMEVRQKVAAHLAHGGVEARLPHANQIWMLVGFELFRRLSPRYPCIEVFPNAIVRAIAPGCAHKSSAGGFERQLDAFSAVARWDSQLLAVAAYGSRHDRLDAVMSAWIASLPAGDRVGYGDGGNDTIWSARVGPPLM